MSKRFSTLVSCARARPTVDRAQRLRERVARIERSQDPEEDPIDVTELSADDASFITRKITEKSEKLNWYEKYLPKIETCLDETEKYILEFEEFRSRMDKLCGDSDNYIIALNLAAKKLIADENSVLYDAFCNYSTRKLTPEEFVELHELLDQVEYAIMGRPKFTELVERMHRQIEELQKDSRVDETDLSAIRDELHREKLSYSIFLELQEKLSQLETALYPPSDEEAIVARIRTLEDYVKSRQLPEFIYKDCKREIRTLWDEVGGPPIGTELAELKALLDIMEPYVEPFEKTHELLKKIRLRMDKLQEDPKVNYHAYEEGLYDTINELRNSGPLTQDTLVELGEALDQLDHNIMHLSVLTEPVARIDQRIKKLQEDPRVDNETALTALSAITKLRSSEKRLSYSTFLETQKLLKQLEATLPPSDEERILAQIQTLMQDVNKSSLPEFIHNYVDEIKAVCSESKPTDSPTKEQLTKLMKLLDEAETSIELFKSVRLQIETLEEDPETNQEALSAVRKLCPSKKMLSYPILLEIQKTLEQV